MLKYQDSNLMLGEAPNMHIKKLITIYQNFNYFSHIWAKNITNTNLQQQNKTKQRNHS